MLRGIFGKPADDRNQQRGAITSLSPTQAWERLMTESGQCVLLDVREQWEFIRGHVSDATNVPMSQFGRRMDEIPTDRDVLVICQSGSRSMQAARLLHARGHTRIFNVKGGMTMWQLHGLPIA